MKATVLIFTILLVLWGCKNSAEETPEDDSVLDDISVSDYDDDASVDEEDLNELFKGLQQLDSIGKLFGNI